MAFSECDILFLKKKKKKRHAIPAIANLMYDGIITTKIKGMPFSITFIIMQMSEISYDTCVLRKF